MAQKGKHHGKDSSAQGSHCDLELQWAHLSCWPQDGLFLTEALHPYEVFVAAGFEVDLASETGTFGLDFNSLQPPFLSGSSKAIYHNSDHPSW